MRGAPREVLSGFPQLTLPAWGCTGKGRRWVQGTLPLCSPCEENPSQGFLQTFSSCLAPNIQGECSKCLDIHCSLSNSRCLRLTDMPRLKYTGPGMVLAWSQFGLAALGYQLRPGWDAAKSWEANASAPHKVSSIYRGEPGDLQLDSHSQFIGL